MDVSEELRGLELIYWWRLDGTELYMVYGRARGAIYASSTAGKDGAIGIADLPCIGGNDATEIWYVATSLHRRYTSFSLLPFRKRPCA